jgi:hypothetical protein
MFFEDLSHLLFISILGDRLDELGAGLILP